MTTISIRTPDARRRCEIKLRSALKIYRRLDTPAESRYRPCTVRRAIARVDRTRTAKEAWRLWCEWVDSLDADGKAKLLCELGAPGLAFGLLMRED